MVAHPRRLECSVKELFILLFVATTVEAQAGPAIEITNVPPFGSFANLEGRVIQADLAAYRVAVFIYVPGAGWYSKPFCDPQLTAIQPNSSWTADITTGGSDQNATRITALLVKSNYNQPCVQGLTVLPENVTTQAVASATVYRKDPNLRWIQFSGYDWWVKSSSSTVGPGPNYFSNSTNNVWLDGLGHVHMRITNRSNQWQCAELVTARTFGYGSYRFELISSVNDVNLNAVLGLFTWSDDPAYAHREIDVECSRWGNGADVNNAQFVVQPYDIAGHLVRYAVPAGQTNTTHLFVWETNNVSFQSQIGSFDAAPAPASQITNWTYTLSVPQTGDENVRINLWLINGNSPVGSSELEFVISNFQFVPLGPAQPAPLTDISRLANGAVQFSINGQADRRYRVEASTNLLQWQELSTVLATNDLMPFLDTNSTGLDVRFFRVVTLP